MAQEKRCAKMRELKQHDGVRRSINQMIIQNRLGDLIQLLSFNYGTQIYLYGDLEEIKS